MAFTYDYQKDIRLDVGPNSYIMTVGRAPVNYCQRYSNIYNCSASLQRGSREFYTNKNKEKPTITLKKSKRELSEMVTLLVYQREYKKTVKKIFFSIRKKIVGKNPQQDLANNRCAQWGMFYKKSSLLKDVTSYGLDLEYLNEYKYRCWIAELKEGKLARQAIENIERKNHDFLVNTKYLINPPVLELLGNIENIPHNLRKFHVQLLACASNKGDQKMFDLLTSCTSEHLIKQRNLIQRKFNEKLDLRKFRKVCSFYHKLKNLK